MLLKIEADKLPLVYAEVYESSYLSLTGRVELRFEAPSVYSLHFHAARDHGARGHLPPKRGSKFAEVGILEEPSFIADSSRVFGAWTSDLKALAHTEFPRDETYDHLVREAIETDVRQAAQVEDPELINAAQQALLDALRAHKRYGSCSKEGVVVVQMEGGSLVRRETGDENSEERYESRSEMLTFLRNYFNWEATRDTIPHKPPELEIWRFIVTKFS